MSGRGRGNSFRRQGLKRYDEGRDDEKQKSYCDIWAEFLEEGSQKNIFPMANNKWNSNFILRIGGRERERASG
jgi:hypothetical protein